MVVATFKVVAVMVMLKLAVAVLVGLSESVTVTVKLVKPTKGPVGFPVIAPVLEFKLKPAGRLPTVTAQL